MKIYFNSYNNRIIRKIRNPKLKFGNYLHGRSIWIGQNHQVLKDPISYKRNQGYYAKFKRDINQLKFK